MDTDGPPDTLNTVVVVLLQLNFAAAQQFNLAATTQG
jgi:hypothetical protein